MRAIYYLPLIGMLTACGIPPVDIATGGVVTYALFGDDLEEIKKEDVDNVDGASKTFRDAVPPQAKQGAHRVANNVRDNVRNTARHMKEWWFYDPQKPQYNKAIPASYCYHVQQDVLCYRQPMPGWEHRLVGYQGTGAAPPPPSVTQPLPTIRQADNSAVSRVAAMQPVFVGMPLDPPDEKKDPQAEGGGEVSVPSAQEILPDPALAPQL